MTEILLLMATGMLTGFLLKQRKSLIRIVEKLIAWSIFLLLFLMGLSIGRDPAIVSELPTLGLAALIISLGGILGSMVMAWLIWKWLFSQKNTSDADES